VRLQVPSPAVLEPVADHWLDVDHQGVGVSARLSQVAEDAREHPEP